MGYGSIEMREFGPEIGVDERAAILKLAKSVFDAAEPKREVRAHEFGMEEGKDRVVVREVDVRWDDQRLRVAATEAAERPPFEWIYEISSDVGQSEYFKHYLIRDNDVVLAQRKELFPIDSEEAKLVMADLEAARAAL